MTARVTGWLLLAVLLGHALANPAPHHEADGRPLVVVSELGQRLVSHSRLQEGGDSRLALSSLLEPGDSRLGLPSPQELDAIKKVAQILVMLGEQVIPTIIGDVAPAALAPPASAPGSGAPPPVEDAPNDFVSEN